MPLTTRQQYEHAYRVDRLYHRQARRVDLIPWAAAVANDAIQAAGIPNKIDRAARESYLNRHAGDILAVPLIARPRVVRLTLARLKRRQPRRPVVIQRPPVIRWRWWALPGWRQRQIAGVFCLIRWQLEAIETARGLKTLFGVGPS